MPWSKDHVGYNPAIPTKPLRLSTAHGRSKSGLERGEAVKQLDWPQWRFNRAAMLTRRPLEKMEGRAKWLEQRKHGDGLAVHSYIKSIAHLRGQMGMW